MVKKPTKKELEEALESQRIRFREDMQYMAHFAYLISHNAFDRRFLRELFRPDYNIDIQKASRDIIYFIVTNRYRWSKFK